MSYVRSFFTFDKIFIIPILCSLKIMTLILASHLTKAKKGKKKKEKKKKRLFQIRPK